jgi:hypothetical protein
MFRFGDLLPFMALRSGTRTPLYLLLYYRNTEFLACRTVLLQCQKSHFPPTSTKDFNNTCNYVVFETQEPLQSHNIPPFSYNNFNTHITQCPHRWPQYIIRFTLYVVSVGRPHGPFRSDADQPQRIPRVLNTQTRGHLNDVYILCLHKQSISTVNVTFTDTKIQYSG